MTKEQNEQTIINVPVEFETFYEMLDHIRERPAMYVGVKSLSAVQMYLAGYQAGRHSAGVAPTNEELEFLGFDEFVQKKYRWRDSGGWWGKILYYYKDEAAALDEFFRLLDEYLESKRKQRKRKS